MKQNDKKYSSFLNGNHCQFNGQDNRMIIWYDMSIAKCIYILVPIIINLGLHDKNTYISEREDEESPVKQ